MNIYIKLMVLILSLSGCTSAPIIEIEHVPIRMNKPDYTLDDVERGIIRAGIGLGWEMFKKKPGVIEGYLQKQYHIIIVDITYTMTEYNIIYKDSKNMDYSSGNIHNAYNRWTEDLNKGIGQVLAGIY